MSVQVSGGKEAKTTEEEPMAAAEAVAQQPDHVAPEGLHHRTRAAASGASVVDRATDSGELQQTAGLAAGVHAAGANGSTASSANVLGPRGAEPQVPPVLLLPRWVLPLLTVALIVTTSYMFASQRMERRKAAWKPPNQVPWYLDPFGVHHLGLPVSNLTHSVRFYSLILGGRNLSIGGEEDGLASEVVFGSHGASGSASGPVPWRMVGFGQSRVLLWQAAKSPQQASKPHLALRLSSRAVVADFLAAIASRMEEHRDLHTGACQEEVAFQPHWSVAVCVGPDGEGVHFWQPSKRVDKLFEQARKDWAASASDPRGKDLFE